MIKIMTTIGSSNKESQTPEETITLIESKSIVFLAVGIRLSIS